MPGTPPAAEELVVQLRFGARLAPLLLATLCAGCVAPAGGAAVVAMNALTGVSLAATGKGISDHAVSLVQDQDCRILEGVIRSDRKICEDYGAPATAHDFHGLSTVAEWNAASARPTRSLIEYMRPAEAAAPVAPLSLVQSPLVIPAAFVNALPTAPAIVQSDVAGAVSPQ